MRQQVNLFQPMFRRQHHVLSAQALLHSVVVACVGLMLIYGFAAWNVYRLGGDVRALEKQRDAASARLVDVERRVPRRDKSRVLASDIARADAQRARHRRLVRALSERQVGNPAGLSGYFSGLARQRVDGLWLTGVEVSAGGSRVAIGGSALDPALVPRLVQRLADEPPYAGVRFGALTIGRPEREDGRVDFELRTTAAEVAR